jgi:HEAT repeat protein
VLFVEKLLSDLTSGDEQRGQSAVEGLTDSDPSVLTPLLNLAKSTDPDHRWWAVCALGKSPHTRTVDLIPFLNDSDPEVRQAAALGLCSHVDEIALPALVGSLSDPDHMTASLAANALVKIGGAAVPFLLEVMSESTTQGTRILALRALAEIKDHRAIPMMLKTIQEDSALLQHWAREGLERLGLDMVYIKP